MPDTVLLRCLPLADLVRNRSALIDMPPDTAPTCGSALARYAELDAGQDETPEHALLGESRPIRALRKHLNQLLATMAPVLITGEPGTGKALVARTLHQQGGHRGECFIVANCANTPSALLEAGLRSVLDSTSGRTIRPAQMGANATLFLDGLDQLSDVAQRLMLDLLREEPDAGATRYRVIATSQKNLDAAAADGTLSAEVLACFAQHHLHMPALRDRHGDLALLGEHFVHFYSQELERPLRPFSAQALLAMTRHDWPGNVRELASRVRRALVLAEGNAIEATDLGLALSSVNDAPLGTLQDYKRRAERQALCDVLNRHSDNLSVAAKVLGISRPTFYRLLHKHQIR